MKTKQIKFFSVKQVKNLMLLFIENKIPKKCYPHSKGLSDIVLHLVQFMPNFTGKKMTKQDSLLQCVKLPHTNFSKAGENCIWLVLIIEHLPKWHVIGS